MTDLHCLFHPHLMSYYLKSILVQSEIGPLPQQKNVYTLNTFGREFRHDLLFGFNFHFVLDA